jgi:hypothetical protein
MRFYLEPDMLTGKTDVLSVQAIGDEWVDKRFVVEAESEEEARDKLIALLVKRVYQGQVRVATEEESKEFEMWQYDAYQHERFADELVKKIKKDQEQAKKDRNEQAK